MSKALTTLAFELAARDASWPVLPIVLADFRTGEIIYVSKFAADIFDYEPERLLGQAIEMLVPEEIRLTHARWRQDAQTPRTRLMGVGRALRGKRRDGSLFPVLITLTSARVLDRDIGVAFVVDLTGIA